MPTTEQKARVKKMLVEQLHLRMQPEEINDDTPLFGDEGLGLDSVDAIELVAGVEQEFGVSFSGEEEAKQVLINVNTLAGYLKERGSL